MKSNYTKQHSIEVGDKSDHSSLFSGETFALSKPEMEAMAQGVRKDLGVKKNDPLDALSIKIEGVDVYVPEKVPGISKACLSYLNVKGCDDWSAMSVPLDEVNEKWAILRNDKHTIERQRVTFLEECWHILLGHKLTKIAKIADSYGRTYDNNEEHDAFYLASATLLPEEAIMKDVREKKSAAEIADYFGASPELVEYRIKRLGLWREYKGKQVKLIHRSN